MISATDSRILPQKICGETIHSAVLRFIVDTCRFRFIHIASRENSRLEIGSAYRRLYSFNSCIHNIITREIRDNTRKRTFTDRHRSERSREFSENSISRIRAIKINRIKRKLGAESGGVHENFSREFSQGWKEKEETIGGRVKHGSSGGRVVA